MKVVGISGAQGAGKSSVLNELKNRGWRVDEFKVSRAVQKARGLDTLDGIMESWESMTSFQEQVFLQKHNHDLVLSVQDHSELESLPKDEISPALGAPLPDVRDDVVLVERTFADLVAYATHWTHRLVDERKVTFLDAFPWLKKYTDQCIAAQLRIYQSTILIPYMHDVIKWEEDKHRADYQSADIVYEQLCRFLDLGKLFTHKKYTISTASISDRADEIQSFIERS